MLYNRPTISPFDVRNHEVNFVADGTPASLLSRYCELREVYITLNLRRAEELEICQGIQVSENDALTSFEEYEGEISEVEVRKRLNIVAGPVVTNGLFNFLDVFSGTVD